MLRSGSLLLALAASPAAAQQSEIVVTGRGLSDAIGERVYSTAEIDRDRLTGSASNRLDEILKDVPGLQLFRRSDARSANPTSQGVTLRALGGNASSRALLILDGVPQADPFGGWVNWAAYDPQRLGSARVVRGGGTGAQGPGALAGTIELDSADPDEAVAASLDYGSRDSVDARTLAGAFLGRGFVSISASYAHGDGFIPVVARQRGPVDRPSPYEQASIAIRGVAPVAPNIELQANGLWFTDTRERGTAFTRNNTQGADASLRLVGTGRTGWSALAYVQTRDYYNSFASIGADRQTASQASEQYGVPSTGIGARAELRPYLGEDLELRIGGDWRRTEGETRERYNFQNGIGTRGRIAGGISDTMGGFVEGAWQKGALTLTAGGRVDRWMIRDGRLFERVFATSQVLTAARFPDRSGWEATGRGGAAFTTGPLTLRGAAYLGWRLPTLNELYRPFRVGADATAANAMLTPERLKGVEAGIDLRPMEGASIGVTLFSSRLTDAIANVTLGTGPGTFPGVGFVAAGATYNRRDNLDGIDARGIEADARVARGSWTLTAGYAFVDAQVKAGGAALPLDGLRPAQTPRHSAAATLGWRAGDDLRASASIRYIAAQYEDDLNTQRISGALTFDAAASAEIEPGIRLNLRAENLANTRVIAGISGIGLLERATPRTIWAGLSIRR